MVIAGIDPGLDGGLSFLRGQEVQAFPMPVLATGRKDGQRTLDLGALCSLLREQAPHVCYLEQQQAMHGDGVASSFVTGYGYGALCGVLAALAIPIVEVRAQTWQKTFQVTRPTVEPDDDSPRAKARAKARARKLLKDQIILSCRQLFPSLTLVRKGARTPHSGMADATMIAEYGRRAHLSTKAW